MNWKKKKKKDYVLNDLALIVTSSEVIQIDKVLNVGLQVANEVEPNISVEESSGDLVEAFAEDLLVHHDRVVHLLQSTRYAPA